MFSRAGNLRQQHLFVMKTDTRHSLSLFYFRRVPKILSCFLKMSSLLSFCLCPSCAVHFVSSLLNNVFYLNFSFIFPSILLWCRCLSFKARAPCCNWFLNVQGVSLCVFSPFCSAFIFIYKRIRSSVWLMGGDVLYPGRCLSGRPGRGTRAPRGDQLQLAAPVPR